jgi:RimJ/RimL family protein N-acetyltransferase
VHDIVTERLRLVSLSPDDAQAMLEGRTPDGADWAPGYPADGTLVAAAMIVAAEGTLEPWTMFQATRDGRVVCGLGFIEGPDADGAVRIGFSETAESRAAGYTAEALAALVSFAHAQGATAVRADTADPRRASVLREAGLEQVAVCGGLVQFAA